MTVRTIALTFCLAALSMAPMRAQNLEPQQQTEADKAAADKRAADITASRHA